MMRRFKGVIAGFVCAVLMAVVGVGAVRHRERSLLAACQFPEECRRLNEEIAAGSWELWLLWIYMGCDQCPGDGEGKSKTAGAATACVPRG